MPDPKTFKLLNQTPVSVSSTIVTSLIRPAADNLAVCKGLMRRITCHQTRVGSGSDGDSDPNRQGSVHDDD